MGPSQIEDSIDKIFDLLNDGAKDDLQARKVLADLLTDVYNAGYEHSEFDNRIISSDEGRKDVGSTPIAIRSSESIPATGLIQSAYDEMCVKFSGVHSDDEMDSILLRLHAALKKLAIPASDAREAIRAILAEEADIDFQGRRIDYGNAIERIAALAPASANGGSGG
jgi:hypothetical protein